MWTFVHTTYGWIVFSFLHSQAWLTSSSAICWHEDEKNVSILSLSSSSLIPPPLPSPKKNFPESSPKSNSLVWPFFEPKCYPRAVLTLVRINIFHYEEYEDGEKWAIKCSFTWVISYLSTEICYDHSLRSVISFIPYDVLLFISCAIGKTKVSSHGCFAQQGKMRSQHKFRNIRY